MCLPPTSRIMLITSIRGVRGFISLSAVILVVVIHVPATRRMIFFARGARSMTIFRFTWTSIHIAGKKLFFFTFYELCVFSFVYFPKTKINDLGWSLQPNIIIKIVLIPTIYNINLFVISNNPRQWLSLSAIFAV